MIALNTTIDPQKSMRELLGGLENREKFKSDPLYLEFQKQIRRILAVADQYALDYGEVLLYINRTYGQVWDTLPYYKFAEIEHTIRQNWHRLFEFLNPQIHAQLMASDNDYSSWYRYQASLHTPKEATGGTYN